MDKVARKGMLSDTGILTVDRLLQSNVLIGSILNSSTTFLGVVKKGADWIGGT